MRMLAGTFFGSAVLGGFWNGCCNCPDFPQRPPALPTLTTLYISPASLFSAPPSDGGVSSSPYGYFEPMPGSLEVTGENVIISYRDRDVDHRVVYRVSGH